MDYFHFESEQIWNKIYDAVVASLIITFAYTNSGILVWAAEEKWEIFGRLPLSKHIKGALNQ